MYTGSSGKNEKTFFFMELKKKKKKIVSLIKIIRKLSPIHMIGPVIVCIRENYSCDKGLRFSLKFVSRKKLFPVWRFVLSLTLSRALVNDKILKLPTCPGLFPAVYSRAHNILLLVLPLLLLFPCFFITTQHLSPPSPSSSLFFSMRQVLIVN